MRKTSTLNFGAPIFTGGLLENSKTFLVGKNLYLICRRRFHREIEPQHKFHTSKLFVAERPVLFYKDYLLCFKSLCRNSHANFTLNVYLLLLW